MYYIIISNFTLYQTSLQLPLLNADTLDELPYLSSHKQDVSVTIKIDLSDFAEHASLIIHLDFFNLVI